MIILPFSRKKKEKLRKALPKRKEGVKEKIKREPSKKEIPARELKEIGKSSIAPFVLKEPRISEKGTLLGEEGKYIFKVSPQSNKPQIKRAIEDVYKVKVEKVNIIKVPGKKRRMRGIEGFRSGYKKAIVALKKGQKIKTTLK